MADIKQMQIGQVVDFVIAYNDRQEKAERQAKKEEKRKEREARKAEEQRLREMEKERMEEAASGDFWMMKEGDSDEHENGPDQKGE